MCLSFFYIRLLALRTSIDAAHCQVYLIWCMQRALRQALFALPYPITISSSAFHATSSPSLFPCDTVILHVITDANAGEQFKQRQCS
jgi:hypothetical protein